jgi:hypothetical protein
MTVWRTLSFVMAGLDPAICVFPRATGKTWTSGTSLGVTSGGEL